MAKKDDKLANLRDAVEKQAKTLDPAQREFVKVAFGTYEWNAAKISELEGQLESGVVDSEGIHNYDAEGKLFRQRHQLVAEQATLFSHIMRWLKNTEVKEESEFEKFLSS